MTDHLQSTALDIDAIATDLYRMSAEAHSAYMQAADAHENEPGFSITQDSKFRHMASLCTALSLAIDLAVMVRTDRRES